MDYKDVIIQGDSIKEMQKIPDRTFDFCFADPPYFMQIEEGKKLFVHHMKDVEAGKTVEFDKVLLVDADGAVKVGAPTVEGAKVVVEVVNPLVKGDKVIVFKMKRRKDSRKRNGHREQFTQVEVKQVIA